MGRPSPIVVLEFNELTPSLMSRFISEGHLPNFRKLRDSSHIFTTDALARGDDLEPWIQWVTVHSGLRHNQHHLGKLDEGHKLAEPRVWDVLSRSGISSLIFGSMNVNYEAGTKATVLPDPWTTKVEPSSAELAPYFNFVSRQVREHTNPAAGTKSTDYLGFARWMLAHGLSVNTLAVIARQLASERVVGQGWKRAMLLDWLQFDAFAHFYHRTRPQFSTFFLNSTAHYQHAYWDALEPDEFESVRQDIPADAILAGYRNMDRLVGRFFRLLGDGATVVLCSALSQRPVKNARLVYYRPKEFARVASLAGVTSGFKASNVMTDQLHLEFETEEGMRASEEKQRALILDGRPVLRLVHEQGRRLFASCAVRSEVPLGTPVSFEGRSVAFSDLFYRVPTGKVADHHPDGILWIRRPDGTGREDGERVPLTSVAPTFLNLLGVGAPREWDQPLALA